MATIKYLLQSEVNPANIYVRMRVGRLVDLKAKTKYTIDPSYWNESKGQIKSLKDASLKKLNEELEKLRLEILKQFNHIEDSSELNSNWLKNLLHSRPNEAEIPSTLIGYFDYYALHKKSSLAKSTFTKLGGNKNLLLRFQKATHKEYRIKDIDANFKLAFESYCKQENYSVNTIARALKFIKTICYHARNNGIETHFQLNTINLKIEKVEKIYLKPDEIDLIEQAEIKLDHLQNARDWLIISCETGQRVSDFMRFNQNQIRYESGVPLIEFTQVKTGKVMAVPLSKKVRAILEKRGGNFPRRISDQRYNEYIKEVCKIAGITAPTTGSKINKESVRKEKGTFPKYELVTSHIGRRTFATNNYGRIPTSLLINVTGHSTESMFLEYIGKTVTEKAKQLAEYF